jgi:hypothetical protein
LEWSTQVLPSSAVKLYSPAFSPVDTQPVNVRVESLFFCSSCAAKLALGTIARLDSARKLSANFAFIKLPPVYSSMEQLGKAAHSEKILSLQQTGGHTGKY